jgi:DNA-binding IscR family transcriptional regulator
LIKAIARAFRWQKMLETSKFTTIREIAKAERINPSYVSRVLRLTLLALRR